MRAYLLGTADPSVADALERDYFSDKKILAALNEQERELIIEYLDNRLCAVEKGLFERRYLRIPVLRARLELVRSERKKQGLGMAGVAFRLPAIAFSLVLVALAGGWVHMRYSGRLTETPRAPVPEVQPTILSLVLAPGVNKGRGRTAEILLTRPGTRLRFLLDGRGIGHEHEALADIVSIEADGSNSPVWASGQTLLIDSTSGSPRFMLEIDSNILGHGDYMINLRLRDGAILERFLFRVNRP